MSNRLTWGVDGRPLVGVDRRQFAKGGGRMFVGATTVRLR
jgi:hypothetical protein